LFTKVLPVAVVCFGLAIYTLISFFTEPPKITQKPSLKAEFERVKKEVMKPTPRPKPQRKKTDKTAQQIAALTAENEKLKQELDDIKNPMGYIDKLATETKPRLQMLLYTTDKVIGRIEFLDKSFRAKERLTIKQLEKMGWAFDLKIDYLIMSKGDSKYTVTSWPIEPFARTSDKTANKVSQPKQVASNH